MNEYGFGSNPDLNARDRVKAMDQEKLKQAPVNNLDLEHSVLDSSATSDL